VDEIRAEVNDLVARAVELQEAANQARTPSEFAAWLDQEFILRDPQVPLANMYVLIEDIC
jgi:hypothetical protein